MNLEAGFDFVEVYETNEAGKLLGLFTGSVLPPSVVSVKDTVYINFQTDASGQRLGFKIRWDTFGCPKACGNRGSCVWDYCYCDEGYFGGTNPNPNLNPNPNTNPNPNPVSDRSLSCNPLLCILR